MSTEIFFCSICEREFKSQRSLQSHANWHNPEHKTKCKGSGKKGYQTANLAEINQIRSEKTRILYYTNPKICSYCNTILVYERRSNKFCDSSCAAKNSNLNRSKESRKKQGISLKLSSFNCPKQVKYYSSDIISRVFLNNCKVCIKKFYYKSSRVTCSDKCYKENLSKLARERMPLGIKRSKNEVALYEMCNQHFEYVSHNKIIADGWDSDITLDDLKVAIFWDGPWHYRDMGIKGHSLSQVQNRDKIKNKLFSNLGWKVLVFQDRTYTPKSAFKYIKDFVESLT